MLQSIGVGVWTWIIVAAPPVLPPEPGEPESGAVEQPDVSPPTSVTEAPAMSPPSTSEVDAEPSIVEAPQPAVASEPAPEVAPPRRAPPPPRPSASLGPSLLGPSTRTAFIELSLGGTRPLRTPEYGLAEIGEFHIEQAIGVHAGDGHGFGVAAVAQQTIGADAYVYAFAMRLQYDAAIAKGLGVYLTPMLTVGYRRVRHDAGVYAECSPRPSCFGSLSHQVTVQVGLAVKFVLADRLILSFRPVGLDIGAPHALKPYGGDTDVAIRWQMVGGLGISF